MLRKRDLGDSGKVWYGDKERSESYRRDRIVDMGAAVSPENVVRGGGKRNLEDRKMYERVVQVEEDETGRSDRKALKDYDENDENDEASAW